MNCLFCKIINKEEKSTVLYEDTNCIAILDIDPESDGHTLIIPKKHINEIDELSDITAHSIFVAIKCVTKLLKSKYEYKGVKIFTLSGKHLQDIPHLHIHVIGR